MSKSKRHKELMKELDKLRERLHQLEDEAETTPNGLADRELHKRDEQIDSDFKAIYEELFDLDDTDADDLPLADDFGEDDDSDDYEGF